MRAMMRTLLVAAVLTAPAAAQTPVDSPWTPFFGCWSDGAARATGLLTCVLPGETSASAEFVTVRDGEVQQRRTLTADGHSSDIVEGSCRGGETRQRSADGTRIELQGELRCGDRPAQQSSGLDAIVHGDWLSINSLSAPNGRPALQVARRRAVSWDALPRAAAETLVPLQRAIVSARAAADVALTADRIEAVAGATAPAVAEAWMLEMASGADLRLSVAREDLEGFAAAGLATSTIDLAVALAHPDRFQLGVGGRPLPVRALATAGEGQGLAGLGASPWPMQCLVPPYFGMMPYWACMDVGAYAFGTPWGFSRWGTYPGFFPGYGYPIVVVRPGGFVPPSPDNGGRVDRDRGYTQRNGQGSGTAQPRGSSAPTVRTEGRSSGGSSTGRTAKPRKP